MPILGGEHQRSARCYPGRVTGRAAMYSLLLTSFGVAASCDTFGSADDGAPRDAGVDVVDRPDSVVETGPRLPLSALWARGYSLGLSGSSINALAVDEN